MNIQSDQSLVQVAAGMLEGAVEAGLHVFRGVPYAQPPVGALRFHAPRPLRPWSGTRPAKVAGPASLQMNAANTSSVLREAETMDPGVPGIPSWPGYVGKTYNHDKVSEDCLYLDIWVPRPRPGVKLPVYVYYHGGANAVSSGSFNLERGSNLAAQEDIIVVRPNYRMGALGWVHFGLLDDTLPEAVNLGLRDQIAALQWVSDNIEAFGGDKDNITIGGESAGATAVSHLLTYPGTQHLFKRAIIQSLSPFNVWCTQEREQAASVAQQYLDLLGIKDMADLMHIDPIRLLAVQNVLARYLRPDDNVAWRPLGGVVDGAWIPQLPAEYLSTQPVPETRPALMIGFAKDEWQFFRGHSETLRHGSEQDALAVLTQVFGKEPAEALYAAYRRLHPTHAAPGFTLSDIMSMEFFKFSSLLIAANFAAQDVPAYVFQFAYDLPGWGGELRAVHTGDMPFLWRNYTPEDLQAWPSFDGVDVSDIKRVSDEMGRHYASFIRTGKPGSEWKSFDAHDEVVLSFGPEVVPINNLLTEEFAAFKAAGIADVRSLEDRLVKSLRVALQNQKASHSARAVGG
jgi:para-nitrobenzyl esterase